MFQKKSPNISQAAIWGDPHDELTTPPSASNSPHISPEALELMTAAEAGLAPTEMMGRWDCHGIWIKKKEMNGIRMMDNA